MITDGVNTRIWHRKFESFMTMFLLIDVNQDMLLHMSFIKCKNLSLSRIRNITFNHFS